MSDIESLHGNVPDKSRVALLLIDLISDFDFPDSDKILKNTQQMVRNVADLKARAKKCGVPVIYINDNFGKWQSDLKKLLKHTLRKSSKGSNLVKIIKPDEEDYFVLKPKHSGFYSTTLDILLKYLGAETLILTGIATDICILFTANDAYMRDYKLYIPQDCVATLSEKENKQTLKYMEKNLKADIRTSNEIDFTELLKKNS